MAVADDQLCPAGSIARDPRHVLETQRRTNGLRRFALIVINRSDLPETVLTVAIRSPAVQRLVCGEHARVIRASRDGLRLRAACAGPIHVDQPVGALARVPLIPEQIRT